MKAFIYNYLDQKPRRFLRIDEAFMKKGVRWCRWGESNSHGSLHTPLKRTCLPVPPHRHPERDKGFTSKSYRMDL